MTRYILADVGCLECGHTTDHLGTHASYTDVHKESTP